jgi:DNA polymerase-4
MASFCRDCLADVPARAARCPACGSPRIARHAELDRMAIAHVDCDAFYATVEKRDDPSLADKPLIVGGGHRGVVTTACYIARTFGVKSAMPMFEARRLCPHAHVIPPDMAKYARVGREVRAMMKSLTPLVEPLSIDEAFLDLTGTERLHGMTPAKTLAQFAQRVERDIGITVSVGLSQNKFLAKIASDLDKPRGFSVLGVSEAPAFLAPRPVTFIWGVGKATGEALARAGFRTIADLQRADGTDLMRRFGAEGQRLARLARGVDARAVNPDRETKSVSAETTFSTDIADFRTLERRFPPAHAGALAQRPDPARGEDLRRRPRPAGARDRQELRQRDEIPPDRHRRQRARRRRGRRPGRPRRRSRPAHSRRRARGGPAAGEVRARGGDPGDCLGGRVGVSPGRSTSTERGHLGAAASRRRRR